MKIQWEESDIRTGIRYGKIGIRETWTIGYKEPEKIGDPRVVSISDVDFMVVGPVTKKNLADSLTDDGYIPVAILEAMNQAAEGTQPSKDGYQ